MLNTQHSPKLGPPTRPPPTGLAGLGMDVFIIVWSAVLPLGHASSNNGALGTDTLTRSASSEALWVVRPNKAEAVGVPMKVLGSASALPSWCSQPRALSGKSVGSCDGVWAVREGGS